MRSWKIAGAALTAIAALSVLARADYVIPIPPGQTTPVFAFICFVTKQCPSHVLIDSTGIEKATQGNPVRIDPTGTTPQPITGKISIDPAVAGLTPVASVAAESSHVLKVGAGNLWSIRATNMTATGGFLAVLNATSAPSDGAILPLDCVPLPANGVAIINYNSGPPAAYSSGIVALVTSSNSCFVNTTGVLVAFIRAAVQ